MGRCLNHPDVETSFRCTKYDIYLCEECLECRDPDIYCKFRTACPIAFISKDQGRIDAEPGRDAKIPGETANIEHPRSNEKDPAV